MLHIVTDALPSTSAGYTVRTQEIALAQRAAGLDPHVVTRIGFPVTAGAIDGRKPSPSTACPTTGCSRGSCPAGWTACTERTCAAPPR